MTIIINLVVSVLVIVALQMIGMWIFSVVTPFNDLEELKKGNTAVGLAFGGEFLSTALIIGVSAYTNTSIWYMMLWFAVGYVILIASYFLLDLVTPGLKISEHLKNGNNAVGILLFCVFLGTSFAISSLII